MCGAGMSCSCNPMGELPDDIVLIASADPIEQTAIEATRTAIDRATNDKEVQS